MSIPWVDMGGYGWIWVDMGGYAVVNIILTRPLNQDEIGRLGITG